MVSAAGLVSDAHMVIAADPPAEHTGSRRRGFARRPGRPRRRTARRRFTAAHRWASLVVGALLVVVVASGVPLLWSGDYFRATNDHLYQPTATTDPLTPGEALESVRQEYPDLAVGWVIPDRGIYLVTDAAFKTVYGVDAGSGRLTGTGEYYGGFMGLMWNLHASGLSDSSYPGHVPVLGTPLPDIGLSDLAGLPLGAFLVSMSGLWLLFLAISGAILWWPGLRRFVGGWRVRWRSGGYLRDRDLHKAIGATAIPFLLVWGLTGAAMHLPSVQKAWLAVTGGNPAQIKRLNFDFSSNPTPSERDIGLDAAVAAALAVEPGRVTMSRVPDPSDPTSAYLFDISQPGRDPYSKALLTGNTYVYVDKYDASRTKVVWNGQGDTASNTFYEQALYPSHFGWYVGPWVRIVWAVFGLAPLVLAITGCLTWIHRVRKRRAQRRRVKERAAA